MIDHTDQFPNDHKLTLEYLSSLRETLEVGSLAVSLTKNIIALSRRIYSASPAECKELSKVFNSHRNNYLAMTSTMERLLKVLEEKARKCRDYGGKPSWEVMDLQLKVLAQELEMRQLDDELKESTVASYYRLKALGLLRFNTEGTSTV